MVAWIAAVESRDLKIHWGMDIRVQVTRCTTDKFEALKNAEEKTEIVSAYWPQKY